MNLSPYMIARGLTDHKLGALLGVSGEIVRLWRHGRRRVSPEKAKVLSELLGIPLHEIRPDIWDRPAKAPQAKPSKAVPTPKRRKVA